MQANPNIWWDQFWHITTGCTKCTPACENCWATGFCWRMAHNPNPTLQKTFAGVASDAHTWTGKINLNEHELDRPATWKKPQRIFVAPTGDLFHPDVPDQWILKVLSKMDRNTHHTFMMCTKQIARANTLLKTASGMMKYARNIWLGATIYDQPSANRIIPLLCDTPAAGYFLSCEPVLGEINLLSIMQPNESDWDLVNCRDHEGEPEEFIEECEAECDWINFGHDLVKNPKYREWEEWRESLARSFSLHRQIDFVIAGGETGKRSRPSHPDWFRMLRDQCDFAHVPFFFKQHGDWLEVDWHTEATHAMAQHKGSFQKLQHKPCSLDRAPSAPTGFIGLKKVGKSNAGHLLDGKEHHEIPPDLLCAPSASPRLRGERN